METRDKIIKVLEKHSELMQDAFLVSCTVIDESSFVRIAIEIEQLLTTPPTKDKVVDTPPPDTSIFGKVELSVSEMCGISIHELKSGKRYEPIPTAKQLIVRVLYELEYKPAIILENMPYMSTIQSIRFRYYASIKYEKYDKRFRIVLNQLKDIYLK